MNTNPYLSKNFLICRDAEQLVVAVEQVVRQCSRYYKYTLGTELRHMNMQVLSNPTPAINQKERRLQWVSRLVLVIEVLKLKIQIGKTLQTLGSFSVFEELTRLAIDIAKQATAWGVTGAMRPEVERNNGNDNNNRNNHSVR